MIYRLSVLPSPNKEFWKELNGIYYKFIANNKPEKHKRLTLIGPHNEGGFQMVDMETQNKALKLGWMESEWGMEGIRSRTI